MILVGLITGVVAVLLAIIIIGGLSFLDSFDDDTEQSNLE